MKIDRSKFFAITTVLAAASGVSAFTACTITTTNTGSDSGADSSTSADSSTGDSSTGDSSTGDSSTGDAAKPDGTAPDAAPTCLDQDGAGTATCTGGAGCMAAPAGQGFCADLNLSFKNAVARDAVKCLGLAPTCEAIPDPFETCAVAALAKACPDPAAAAPCQAAIAACMADGVPTPAINLARCQQLYSGLSASGRTKFATCTVEGCGLIDNSCFLQ